MRKESGNSKKLFFLFILSTGYCASVSAKEIKTLEIPDESHAALTVERGLYGVYVEGDEAFLFPGKSGHFVRAPLNLKASDREAKFGKMTDQVKIPILDAKYPGDWRGMFKSGERLVLFDASMLQILLLRGKDHKTVLSGIVPVDTIKPAADRGGEPTMVETKAMRAKFLRNSRKIFGTKYTGLAEVPESWFGDGKRTFLVSSTIPGFPLIALSCDKKDELSCLVARNCFLEHGGDKFDGPGVTGVAVFGEKRIVAIGDSAKKEIRLYRFDSCFDVRHLRSIRVPARLPKFSNIHIDSGGRLWVTTAIPDSYTDSNLFYWDPEKWQ